MRRLETDAQRAAYAATIMRDAGLFRYWIVDHPRRFATLMGFCDRGHALLRDVAAAFEAEPRRSDMREPTRTDPRRPRGGREAPAGEHRPRRGGTGEEPEDQQQEEGEEEESFAEAIGKVAGGAAKGFVKGTPVGGALISALENVPWDKLFKAILEGAEAKKDKDFLVSYSQGLRAIDRLKDMLITLIDDRPVPVGEQGLFDKIYEGVSKWLEGDGDATKAAERKKKALEELRPRIRQAEEAAHAVGRAIDRGDFDEARKRFKDLVPLLEGIRNWIRDNMK